jgi:hypothetical protein
MQPASEVNLTDTTPENRGNSDRDRAILVDWISGQTQQDIAARHTLTHQGVSAIIKREAREYMNEIEVDLIVSDKMDMPPEHSFVVEFDDPTGWQRPMCVFVWVLKRLRERQVSVRVTTQQTPEGTAFLIQQTKEG